MMGTLSEIFLLLQHMISKKHNDNNAFLEIRFNEKKCVLYKNIILQLIVWLSSSLVTVHLVVPTYIFAYGNL